MSLVVAIALFGAVSLASPPAASAVKPVPGKQFKPPGKKMYHGVSDTTRYEDFRNFRNQVKHHPAVLQVFYHWDVSLKASGAFDRWDKARAIGMVSLSTKNPASGASDIPPSRIANGHVDHFIIRVNQMLTNYDKPVYYRLFPEMNGHWNPYSAFNGNGSSRGSKYSTHAFKKAWKRFVIIARGGTRADINHRLRRLGMPRLHRAKGNNDRIYNQDGTKVPEVLGQPKVSFLWVPQTFGSPNIRGNQPANYWPGKKYVDWVGADIFSKFEGAFPSLQRFYKKYAKKKNLPFAVPEYSPWDRDKDGQFTKRLFKWAKKRSRVRMLVYYRSVTKGKSNPHYISHYPQARRKLRKHLTKRHFAKFGPGR